MQRKWSCQGTVWVCVQHTFKSYGMLVPPIRSLIGSKFQRSRTRVLHPAPKRTPVTPNHCQLSTAVIESVLRLQTIVSSLHENFGVAVKLGPYKPTLDLNYIWRSWKKLFLCQRKVEWLTLLHKENLHKEILNVTKNRKDASLWTCRTRKHMFVTL